MTISKKTIATARMYARLDADSEYPDTAAAVMVSRALLRVLGLDCPRRKRA